MDKLRSFFFVGNLGVHFTNILQKAFGNAELQIPKAQKDTDVVNVGEINPWTLATQTVCSIRIASKHKILYPLCF